MNTARIAPAGRKELGPINKAITWTLGAASGTGPPNLFTTLARHRRLFRPWLRFAATMMPAGCLPRRDTELVILRVAHLCDCLYEWRHHVRLAGELGFDDARFAAIQVGIDAGGWTSREEVLLRAVDELHGTRTCSDETWRGLSAELTEQQLIELPMLIGHYVMVAMTVNTLRIQPDEPQPQSAPARAVRKLAARITGRAQ